MVCDKIKAILSPKQKHTNNQTLKAKQCN